MQHNDGQTTKRQAKPEKIGQQVGTEKLPGVQEDPHQAAPQSAHTDYQRAL
jgi:hypothetical protein